VERGWQRPKGDEVLEALRVLGRRNALPIPERIGRRLRVEWSRDLGFGWGLRARARRARSQLERDGFVITRCIVGRKHSLIREGELPKGRAREQGQRRLVALITAWRGEAAGDREPREMPPKFGSGRATVD
jgi:hypothetical protein